LACSGELELVDFLLIVMVKLLVPLLVGKKEVVSRGSTLETEMVKEDGRKYNGGG
jgi:hypothetical protein